MQSPIRGLLLWQIFRTIRQRGQPGKNVDALVEFRIRGRRDGVTDRYRLTLIDSRCRRTPRRDRSRPTLTVELEPVAFLRLVGGTASPQRLLLTGRLKLSGDLKLALALPTILRIPGRRKPRPSRKPTG